MKIGKKDLIGLSLLMFLFGVLPIAFTRLKNIEKPEEKEIEKITNSSNFVTAFNQHDLVTEVIEEHGEEYLPSLFPAKFYKVRANDQFIFIYEFDTEDSAKENFSKISPKGSIIQENGNVSQLYFQKHFAFYYMGNIIALYSGDSKKVISTINRYAEAEVNP